MTNEQYFIEQCFYWAKKLKIKLHHVRPFYFKVWSYAQAQRGYDGINTIFYNIKNLKYDRKYFIHHVIFHELGHFKNDNFSNDYRYDKFTNKIIAEYIAETFALKCLKKYYKKDYNKFCKYIREYYFKRLLDKDYIKN